MGQLKPGLGPEAGEGTGWIFFRSPWGLRWSWSPYPNGRVYEATTTARLWHTAHPER